MNTTNYFNTFIEVSEDCPVNTAQIPPVKASRTVADIQFDLIFNHPYQYTSDDVMFKVFAEKNNIPEKEVDSQRAAFFSKGQPCFRSSPLTKRYGWGVNNDAQGKIAIYAVESPEYGRLRNDTKLQHVKGMRSKKL